MTEFWASTGSRSLHSDLSSRVLNVEQKQWTASWTIQDVLNILMRRSQISHVEACALVTKVLKTSFGLVALPAFETQLAQLPVDTTEFWKKLGFNEVLE